MQKEQARLRRVEEERLQAIRQREDWVNDMYSRMEAGVDLFIRTRKKFNCETPLQYICDATTVRRHLQDFISGDSDLEGDENFEM